VPGVLVVARVFSRSMSFMHVVRCVIRGTMLTHPRLYARRCVASPLRVVSVLVPVVIVVQLSSLPLHPCQPGAIPGLHPEVRGYRLSGSVRWVGSGREASPSSGACRSRRLAAPATSTRRGGRRVPRDDCRWVVVVGCAYVLPSPDDDVPAGSFELGSL